MVQPDEKPRLNKEINNSDIEPPVMSPSRTIIFDKPIATNLALAICYAPLPVVGIAASVLVYMSPSDNARLAKFHAVQSLALTVGFTIISMVVGGIGSTLLPIPIIGGVLGTLILLVNMLASLGYLALSVALAYKAYQGKDVRLPYLSQYVEAFVK
ncbi:MAG: DUF4870 domain-containing protein [Candidatus Obscuribacter phosphatis]|uniref:DUF4870 domain-containing protein n=1 Tax=Candidatus Obscuribacter phosphatis TaxID=1906157 RepID=A0A8J7P876_9BACT|nr:DUF4870 domain-containing protein [Candidatus Obscuribacter phosphatis]